MCNDRIVNGHGGGRQAKGPSRNSEAPPRSEAEGAGTRADTPKVGMRARRPIKKEVMLPRTTGLMHDGSRKGGRLCWRPRQHENTGARDCPHLRAGVEPDRIELSISMRHGGSHEPKEGVGHEAQG